MAYRKRAPVQRSGVSRAHRQAKLRGVTAPSKLRRRFAFAGALRAGGRLRFILDTPLTATHTLVGIRLQESHVNFDIRTANTHADK